MAGKRAYGRDYTDDLLHYRSRGLTVAQAAEQLGISRATAQRLLREKRTGRR